MVSRTAAGTTGHSAAELDFAALAATTYALATQPTDLGRKIASALRVIEEAIAKYGAQHIALSFNGGKDCTALMHLVRAALHMRGGAQGAPAAALTAICVVYKRTFPEADSFIESSVSRYRLDLVEKRGSMRQALQEFKDEHAAVQAIFVGTRQDDPHGSRLGFFSPTDADWPQFMRVNPILDWSFDNVWDFIHSAGVPYCSLYEQGYTSLGDVDSTVRNPALLKDGVYQPAWYLSNACLERNSRTRDLI
ncbi:FAD1 flavin adenine dinucleotide synthetase [Coemansia sp. Benny D115]|nr:FAD1 flavin adenine dinucleotide synthetase [Coemansia sp. Benny D115]